MAAPPKKVGGEGTKRGGTESSPIRRRSRRHFDPNNETCAMINEGIMDLPAPPMLPLIVGVPASLVYPQVDAASYMAASFSLASQQRTRNLDGAGGQAGNFPHSILGSAERKLIAFFARYFL